MHASRGCGLFLQLWHVCRSHGCALQWRLKRSRCRFGADSSGPRESYIRWGRDPSQKKAISGSRPAHWKVWRVCCGLNGRRNHSIVNNDRVLQFYVFTTRQCWRRRYVFVLFVRRVRPFVHPYVPTDLVTTISHERLGQSRWNLRRIFSSPTDDLVRFWWLWVKVTAGRRGGEGIHVDAGASKLMNIARYATAMDKCTAMWCCVLCSCVNSHCW